MKNLAAVESADLMIDPYAPSSSTTAFMDSLAGNKPRDFRDSLLSRSSSFSSTSRGSVRGSMYRSTAFDRQRCGSLTGKSRRHIFTEMAMRDMFFMLVTSRTFFSALSDFELMTGFNQF